MSPKPEKAEKIHKKDQEGWCTDDLEFDDQGYLYIKSEELAREIERVMGLGGNTLGMRRDEYPEEREAREAKEGKGGTVEGPKANMLCPCEPSGP